MKRARSIIKGVLGKGRTYGSHRRRYYCITMGAEGRSGSQCPNFPQGGDLGHATWCGSAGAMIKTHWSGRCALVRTASVMGSQPSQLKPKCVRNGRGRISLYLKE